MQRKYLIVVFLLFSFGSVVSAPKKEEEFFQPLDKNSGCSIRNGEPNISRPRMYMTVEFFMGQTLTNGAEFTEKQNNTVLSTGGTRSTFQHSYQEFDWEPGFTIGLGKTFLDSEWDTYLNFLYFHSNQNKNTDTGETGNLITSRINPSVSGDNNALFSFAEMANTNYKNDVYRLNAEVGKSFFFSKSAYFRMHMGGIYANIVDEQNVIYERLKTSLTTAPQLGQLTVLSRSDFSGGGIRSGINLRYYFTTNWFLFSEPSVALLLGNYNIRMQQRYSVNGGEFLDLANFNRIAPQGEANFGFGYSSYACNQKYYINFRLGYDLQYWWNQSVRWNMTNGLNDLFYDLAIQSCFVRLNFHY